MRACLIAADGAGKEVAACDFCGAGVAFQRVYTGPFWTLSAVDPGAGSDYLATWCAACGPAHRVTADT